MGAEAIRDYRFNDTSFEPRRDITITGSYFSRYHKREKQVLHIVSGTTRSIPRHVPALII